MLLSEILYSVPFHTLQVYVQISPLYLHSHLMYFYYLIRVVTIALIIM